MTTEDLSRALSAFARLAPDPAYPWPAAKKYPNLSMALNEAFGSSGRTTPGLATGILRFVQIVNDGRRTKLHRELTELLA